MFKKNDLLQLINYTDKNNDSVVTLEEFIASYGTFDNYKKLIKYFLLLDTNRDGVISFRDDSIPDGIIDENDLKYYSNLIRNNEPYGLISGVYPRLEFLVKKEIEHLLYKIDFISISSADIKLNNGLKLYFYDIPIENLHSEFENFIILHISDLHFSKCNRNKVRKINKIISYLNKLKIKLDVVVYTGDIIDKANSILNEEVSRVLSNINCNHQYFVLGNHDYLKGYNGNYVRSFFKSINVDDLTNEKISIKRNEQILNIFGVDDFLNGNPIVPSISNHDLFNQNILITHNLDVLRNSYPGCFDLILSGHLHAGEINFGIFSGIDYLKVKKAYHNLNNQIVDWKLLTRRTSSYISPGFQTRYLRFNTQQEGFTLHKLKKSD
jgi:uncharacterized protein